MALDTVRPMHSWTAFTIPQHVVSTLVPLEFHYPDTTTLSSSESESESDGEPHGPRSTMDQYSCSTCNQSFSNLIQQKQHYKSSAHVTAIRQRLDTSSHSSSDSTTPHTPPPPPRQGTPLYWLTSPLYPDLAFGMYKRIFTHTPSMDYLSQKDMIWTLLMLSGGYFASMIVHAASGEVITHKTMHKYTRRKKQGYSQLKHDNMTGGKASGVGAQLRRENELKLQQDVMEWIEKWKDWIAKSDKVFVKVAHWQRDVFAGVYNDKSKGNVCKFPFHTFKPTYKEAQRAFEQLRKVQVSNKADVLERATQHIPVVHAPKHTRQHAPPPPLLLSAHVDRLTPEALVPVSTLVKDGTFDRLAEYTYQSVVAKSPGKQRRLRKRQDETSLAQIDD